MLVLLLDGRSIAYKTTKDGLLKKLDEDQIKKSCKINSRFAGSMRKNVIEMLDELELNKYLEINSCSELFEKDSQIFYTQHH